MEIIVGEYAYQQDVDDPRLVKRRINRHRAAWDTWRTFDTADEARRALLTLREGEKDE